MYPCTSDLIVPVCPSLLAAPMEMQFFVENILIECQAYPLPESSGTFVIWIYALVVWHFTMELTPPTVD